MNYRGDRHACCGGVGNNFGNFGIAPGGCQGGGRGPGRLIKALMRALQQIAGGGQCGGGGGGCGQCGGGCGGFGGGCGSAGQFPRGGCGCC